MPDTREASEGDVNLSPLRAEWRASLSARPRALLDEDERYFLRQSLSTPCLDVIVRAEGAMLIDIEGRRILDFHGNSVHQLGHGHPEGRRRDQGGDGPLPFCPRRYANAHADRARAPARRDRARRTSTSRCSRRAARRRSSMALKLARYATGRHKTLSMWDSFPRRQSRRARRRRRGAVSRGARADGAGRRTSAAARSRAPLLRRRPAVRALCRLYRLCAGGAGRRRRADRRADALDDGRGAAAGLLAARRRIPARATARC